MRPFFLFFCLFGPLFLSADLINKGQDKWAINKQSPLTESILPPYQREVIIIDPGHGGKDHGAKSLSQPALLEKNLTLSTAYLVKRSLEELGYHPILTRKSDHSLSLDDRVEFSNAHRPDLFISIHFNSAPNEDAEGIEIYYCQEEENGRRTKASLLLAQSILKQSLEWTGAVDRKTKKGDWRVIKNNLAPSVLIEGGFLTNNKETRKLKNPYYLKRLGLGIAKGIDDYLTQIRALKKKYELVNKRKA